MRLPLKSIALLVVLSLTLIFAYQAFWLVNLYNTQTRLLEVRILEAMRSCDYNEMILRVKKLKQEGSMHGSVSVSAGYSVEEDQAIVQSETSVSVTHKGGEGEPPRENALPPQELRVVTDTVMQKQETVEETGGILATSQGLGLILEQEHSTEQLGRYFQQGLHSGIDVFSDPDVALYDSLLTARLAESGLDTRHRLSYIHQGRNADSTYTYSDTLATAGTPDYRPHPAARAYEHHTGLNGNKFYLLQMNPVGGTVLRQMAGILTTSLVILCILGFSFYYLIRTLLRQKTLEEMKSDFTHNITHELKTPIAVAYAANDALLNFHQDSDPDTRSRYLRICQEQLSHLGALVEQILSTSMERRKGFELHREEVTLRELLTPLVEQHQLKADKPARISLIIAPEALTVNADRTHLSNIVSNLIDNAIKYSRTEAEVEIQCLRQADGTTTLSVGDHGIGLTPEQCRHVFDKFYRVPQGNRHDVKGYGLGLYYVKTLVELHGWHVGVESEAGQGSTFTITTTVS